MQALGGSKARLRHAMSPLARMQALASAPCHCQIHVIALTQVSTMQEQVLAFQAQAKKLPKVHRVAWAVFHLSQRW